MILEWTLYLEAQTLSSEDFLTTTMKARKYFLQTWWKYGRGEDGGWKGGGWLCEVLGLPLMLFGGRYRRIGEDSFQCGDFPGGFWSGSGEMRRTVGFWDSVGWLWMLGVGSLWQWGNIGYWYSLTKKSCLSPLSSLPLYMQWWYYYEHAHIWHTREGGERACKVTT